jgi:hypothetical protein
MEKNPFREHRSTTVAFLSNSRRIARARAFYETAGGVKVFVFAFVFSLLAFLFLLLPLLLPFLACCIHLGLLSALCLNLVWVRCLLVSDDDEVALLSKGRPVGPRPGSQSPEHEFGYALWQEDRFLVGFAGLVRSR